MCFSKVPLAQSVHRTSLKSQQMTNSCLRILNRLMCAQWVWSFIRIDMSVLKGYCATPIPKSGSGMCAVELRSHQSHVTQCAISQTGWTAPG